MKAVIQEITYDTEAAELLTQETLKIPEGYYENSLYRNQTGEYFIYQVYRDTRSEIVSEINPITEEKAKRYIKESKKRKLVKAITYLACIIEAVSLCCLDSERCLIPIAGVLVSTGWLLLVVHATFDKNTEYSSVFTKKKEEKRYENKGSNKRRDHEGKKCQKGCSS